MTRARLRLFLPILALAICAAAISAPHQTPKSDSTAHQAWDAGTRYADWEAPSTLTLVNDCKKDHSFSVTKTNADFLDFLFSSPVRVPGKRSITVPVKFHTNGMAPGDFTGEVTVLCIDCTEVPPCTQDKRLLAPHINVIPRPRAPADNPSPAPRNDCRTDCGDLSNQLTDADNHVKILQQKSEAASAQVVASHQHSKEIKKELDQAIANAFRNNDINKVSMFLKAVTVAQDNYNRALQEVDDASAIADKAFSELQAARAEAEQLFKGLQDCLAEAGFCHDEGQPRRCTPENPCDDGWTGCEPGRVCGPPSLCTPEYACRIGITYKSPIDVIKTKSTCTQSKEDCAQLRLLAEQKEAGARAAQETADAAAAEATKQEAAAKQTAGKDPRDVIAQQETARSARENATTMQRAADRAKASAAAARKLADDCAKKLKDDCPQVPAQSANTGNPGGPPSESPCPPANGGDGFFGLEDPRVCAKEYDAWQEAERQAVIAQMWADEAARHQQWSTEDAASLNSQSGKEEGYAKEETDRAKTYRELAGGFKGLAAKNREIAGRCVPGSSEQAFWTKLAKEDEESADKFNADADAAEQLKMQYHMKAAADRTKAAQLKDDASSAQARADAAKAAAKAAKQAYDDCIARHKKQYMDCLKKAETAHTTGRGQPGGQPGVGTNTGGSNPGGTNPGGNPNTANSTAMAPKMGTQGIPGVGGRHIDNLQTTESRFCHWITLALPVGAKVEGVFIRNILNSTAKNDNVEAREGKTISPTGQSTIEYHCKVDDGTAVVAYTYLLHAEPHVGRLLVSCTQ